MNSVILIGRLTKDPDVKTSNSGTKYARYTLAVDRRNAKNDGDQTADFISCVCFGKGAEFAEKYLFRGTKILVEGRLQTGSYTDRDGHKVYTTDVMVEQHEFVEPRRIQDNFSDPPAYTPTKTQTSGTAPEPRQTSFEDFMPIPDDLADEGLPFM